VFLYGSLLSITIPKAIEDCSTQSKREDRGIFFALEQEGRKEEEEEKDGSCDTSYIDGGVHQVQDASGSKSPTEGEEVLL